MARCGRAYEPRAHAYIMSLQGRRILYISYNGMLEPLGQSQVVPYLVELSKLDTRFTLLSFERANAFTAEGAQRAAALEQRLAEDGIEWHRLRYHKSPSLPATAFDVLHGIRKAEQLVRQKVIELVHARSHIPAMIALRMKQQFGVKMIFDVRGLMADEYVDASHWRRNSVSYRITKAFEQKALAAADGIVTLTERIWPILQERDGVRERNALHEVIPCCADLEKFRFNLTERARLRMELGIADRFVVIYSGSIDGWYLTEQMADFFVTLRNQNSAAYFLWLTTIKHNRIRQLMKDRGISDSDYRVLAASPHEVPRYLCASDAGLAFIKPCFSKLASSPTKYAEYLGCGLPLIINAGIGDADTLITDERVGALVENITEVDYAQAARTIGGLTVEPELIRARTREVAERMFDVRTVGAPRYARLYEQLFADAN